ncbi:MAG: MFS transporter [Deltaproteobacteria bacterium]|nr:MFS transporter [Deltaproteobacteria bacterium]
MKPSPFILLCATGLFAIFSSTISKSPALPLFTSYLGGDPSMVGMVAAVSAFTGIVASIPAGILADRWGRKRLLVISAIIFASAPFLYLLVTKIWQLAIIRFYHGLATAIFVPVAMALIAGLFHGERGERMGWFSTATLFGRFMAPVIGGAIIGAMALNPEIGYKVVYLVCGGAGILVLLLALKIPDPNGGAKNYQNWKETLRAFKTVISNKEILFTSVVEAAILFAYGTFETFLPLYSLKIGLSAYIVGIFLSAQVITLALAKPVMGRFSDKHGRRPQIFAGAIIGAVCIGAFSFFTSFVPLLVLSVSFGLSLSIVTSATAALIADLSKKETHGVAMGTLGSIMDMGHTTGPLISGFIAAYFGLAFSFVGASVILLFFAFVFLWGTIHHQAVIS